MRLLSKFFYLIIITLQLGFVTKVYAQKNKSQLEKEKSSVQKQIQETQQILAQTANKKKASIGQLNAIKKQIEGHTKLIKTYSYEVKMVNGQIEEDVIVIDALQQDLDNFKKEYAAMVYAMYKSSNGFNRLSFIFASSNLSQFYMRFKYLEQYTSARKNQVKLISEIKAELGDEKISLENTLNEKNILLSEQLKEKEKLDKLRAEQDKVFAKLKNEETNLTKDIAKKKNEVNKLENLISKLLKEEIKNTASAAKEAPSVNIDLKNISSSFEKSKANLHWPVSSGFISEKFGTHPHPILKRVKMPNDGVNIQTKQNELVKAVFKGEVKKIAIVPGDFKYVVIMQHGAYFTVYAKLKKVNVKMGQQIERDDVIGEVNTDVDGTSEVQFQVWKNTQKLDPELWLTKR
ncbi:MAG: peptidoglycan DD-metalloendopeptidase family protein [Cyclobacteriaceae bacterium]|nr:peptidoglycan DD-metalloendopeptidase family protein [Cyclobacteriaceae bacterium]